MRTVKDILNSKPESVFSIPPNMLVYNALKLLKKLDSSYLVVMDSSKYIGVFCERDYSRNVILQGRSSKETMVSEVMTVDFPIVSLDDTAEHCMQVMNAASSRYLLAFEDEKIIGVITGNDLLKEVLTNKEFVFDGPEGTSIT